MATDPGPRPAPPPPLHPAPPVSAYAVLAPSLELLGERVLAAARTTDDLSSRPAGLPAATARAGSPPLQDAAASFAEAWSRECAGLAHETRLLGDAVLAAASAYRSAEWAVAAAVSSQR